MPRPLERFELLKGEKKEKTAEREDPVCDVFRHFEGEKKNLRLRAVGSSVSSGRYSAARGLPLRITVQPAAEVLLLPAQALYSKTDGIVQV